MNDYKFNTTTMCIEGKHLLCDGELRFDDWERQCTCNCLCHNIIYAIMLDHHIAENEAKMIAHRVMRHTLIIAAPDMYEALKEIKLVWTGLDPDRRFPHLEEVITKAIAKAEGK